MRKARFTEEQIIGILKEHDARAKAEDLCRRHGIRCSACAGNGPGRCGMWGLRVPARCSTALRGAK
jgi:hypothetical protein